MPPKIISKRKYFCGKIPVVIFIPQVLTNCDLQMVGEEFSRKPYALAVQQGSPLKDQFNDA